MNELTPITVTPRIRGLISISRDKENPTVSGRELHKFLEVETHYKDWFPRMLEYGFVENIDYLLVAQICATNNPKNPTTTRTDHAVTLDMAKELCMIQRTPKGKQARQYFIATEKAWINRAAESRKELESRVDSLVGENNRLKEHNKTLAYDNYSLKETNKRIIIRSESAVVKQYYFSAKEVAFMLGIQPAYLKVLQKRGKLPPAQTYGKNKIMWKSADILPIIYNPEFYFGKEV